MRFEFAAAGRIVFGAGAVKEVGPAARQMGGRPLLVSGHEPARAEELRRELDAAVFAVEGEPTVEAVRRGVAAAREERADVVIGFGGGSAIDAGKAIAALLANGGDPLDYLEVIGKGQPLRAPSAPYIAVPTTAGTGSEVTRNAVLGSPDHGVKASLRSAGMLPRLAVVDPELTLGLPPGITASTGLDALTQLIEPYVSSRANAMTDVYCVDGMRRAASALPQAYAHGDDLAARTEMSLASLFGGLALANAGLGAVHGFAAPVGGMFPAPHGAVCAALLPHAMAINIHALRARMPDGEALRRYAEVARILTRSPGASPEDGAAWVAALCRDLRIPPLRTYGIAESHLAGLVENAARASSMKANPVALRPEELNKLLLRAL